MTVKHNQLDELRDKFAEFIFIGLEEQLANVEEWVAEKGSSTDDKATLENFVDPNNYQMLPTGSIEDLLVVTPNLADVQTTTRFLWKKVASQFTGVVSSHPLVDPHIDRVSPTRLIGLGAPLPGSMSLHPQTRDIPTENNELRRPPHRLSLSRINFLAHLNLSGVTGESVPPHRVRNPYLSPHVEVLSMLAHNPDFVERMGSGPWLWLPGARLYDERGYTTPQIPIVSMIGHTLSLSAAWEDSGMQQAAVPEFVTPLISTTDRLHELVRK